MNRSVIFLVGMPGSGKSYFSRKLAACLGAKCIDLDKVIENQEGSIKEIFRIKGEAWFRELESRVLREVTRKESHVVIATGGGTPCYHDGLNFMKDHGLVVYLRTSLEILIERLERKKHRPLIQKNTQEKVKQLLEEREPVYSQAHHSIEHRDARQLINELESLKIEPKGG